MHHRESLKILLLAWTIPPRLVLGIAACMLLAAMSFCAAYGWCAAAAALSLQGNARLLRGTVQADREAVPQVAPQDSRAQQVRCLALSKHLLLRS